MKKKEQTQRKPGGQQLNKGENMVMLSFRVSLSQHAKFYRLGGSGWGRKAIDSAKER